MSEWDEYSGNALAIEVALDARGAAVEIQHLRRYRRAYAKVEERIRARIDFVRRLISNAEAAPLSRDVRDIQIAKYEAEINGLEVALTHLALTLAEEMER